jgi:hypothetical protein
MPTLPRLALSRVSEVAGLAAILPVVARQRKPPRGSIRAAVYVIVPETGST